MPGRQFRSQLASDLGSHGLVELYPVLRDDEQDELARSTVGVLQMDDDTVGHLGKRLDDRVGTHPCRGGLRRGSTLRPSVQDVIIRGGENIASKEVEDLLALHPVIVEAAAVGRPDRKYGERVAACVQLRPGATIGLDEIRRHFAGLGVARQKTPEHLEIVDALPRSLSGKVRKVDLRDRLRNNILDS